MTALTIQEFGRGWYFKQAPGWGPRRSRAIRRVCLESIMPLLGTRSLAGLKVTHVRRWLRELVACKSTITVHFAAYTLRALLEAAQKQGHLSPSQWDELRTLLAYGAVEALCTRHRAQGGKAGGGIPDGSASEATPPECVSTSVNTGKE